MKKAGILLPALLLGLAGPGCGAHAIIAPLRYDPPPPAPDEAFRATAPEARAPVPRAALPWRVTRLPNGLRVAHLERHALPVVTVRLVIERGAADTGTHDDAYDILASLLEGGTARRTGPELAEAWARLGAARGVSFGGDACGLWAKVGAGELDATVSLLAEAATQPRLTKRAFEDARAAWGRDVANTRFAVSAILQRNVLAALFGRDHAYSRARRPATHTDALRVEDLIALHARLFQPAQATLVVVGDVTPETVDATAARWLGAWPSPAEAPLPRGKVKPPVSFGAHVIHHELDGIETNVAILARGPAAREDDIVAFEVLARAFGGLSSRLRGDVRETRGAAYVFSAGVNRYRMASFLDVQAALAAGRAMPSLRAMLDTIREVARNGIGDGELERARTSLLSDWRTRVATTDGLAALASAALAHDAPLDEIARYPERVQAVTREDVRRVARQYLADEALRIVVTGAPSLRAELEALGLGAVERRDNWGEIVSP